MAVKTVKDLEKLQRQMSDRFDRFLKTQPGERAAPEHGELPTLVEEARASLDAAIRQREEGLRIADQRIERKKKELATLQASLERAKGQAEQPPEKKKKKTPKAEKAADEEA